MRDHPEHAAARSEAFGWHSGTPPTPMAAACHFAAQAERDPANRAHYAESLRIFLAVYWNIRPSPTQEDSIASV